MEVFYKLILSFWVYVVWYAQSTQNNKFAISFEYLMENLKDEVDFLSAVKHQRFLQIDTIILGACGQAGSYNPKQQGCYFFAIY